MRRPGGCSVGVVSDQRRALSFIAAALHLGLEGRPGGAEVFPAAPCEEDGADGAGEGDSVDLVAQRPSEQGEEQADDDGAEEGQGQLAHHSAPHRKPGLAASSHVRMVVISPVGCSSSSVSGTGISSSCSDA